MASVKVTFTLDAATRLAKPQSEIVREAIRDFCERIGRLSERERLGMLRVFDELVPKIPARSAEGVDKEILAIRQARKKAAKVSLIP